MTSEVLVLIGILFLVVRKRIVTQTDLRKRKKVLGYVVGKCMDVRSFRCG